MHIVFDAYGTLLDVHSAAARHDALLGDDRPLVSELWRTRQLEYAWVATLTDRYEPFWTLTERALGTALAQVGRADDPALRRELLAAYTDLAPFDDVLPALSRLADDGHVLSVLSNGNPDMLERVLAAANIADRFRHVLSVEPARRYKPHPDAYRVAEAALAASTRDIVFVSSNAWDAAGAAVYGFRSHWLNRGGRPVEYPGVEGVTVLPSLADLRA